MGWEEKREERKRREEIKERMEREEKGWDERGK